MSKLLIEFDDEHLEDNKGDAIDLKCHVNDEGEIDDVTFLRYGLEHATCMFFK